MAAAPPGARRRAGHAVRSKPSAREALRRRSHGARACARRRCHRYPLAAVGRRTVRRHRTSCARTRRRRSARADVPLTDRRRGRRARHREPRGVRPRASRCGASPPARGSSPKKSSMSCRRGSRFIVKTDRGEHEADRVIGADGAEQHRAEEACPRRSPGRQLSVAAGYFVHGATSSAIVIKSMREQPGYLWSFPRPDHLAVGICAPATQRVSVGSAARAVASLDSAARVRPRHHAHARMRGPSPASATATRCTWRWQARDGCC